MTDLGQELGLGQAGGFRPYTGAFELGRLVSQAGRHAVQRLGQHAEFVGTIERELGLQVASQNAFRGARQLLDGRGETDHHEQQHTHHDSGEDDAGYPQRDIQFTHIGQRFRSPLLGHDVPADHRDGRRRGEKFIVGQLPGHDAARARFVGGLPVGERLTYCAGARGRHDLAASIDEMRCAPDRRQAARQRLRHGHARDPNRADEHADTLLLLVEQPHRHQHLGRARRPLDDERMVGVGLAREGRLHARPRGIRGVETADVRRLAPDDLAGTVHQDDAAREHVRLVEQVVKRGPGRNLPHLTLLFLQRQSVGKGGQGGDGSKTVEGSREQVLDQGRGIVDAAKPGVEYTAALGAEVRLPERYRGRPGGKHHQRKHDVRLVLQPELHLPNSKFSGAGDPAETVTVDRTDFARSCHAMTSYWPGGTSGIRKCPSLSLTAK